MSRRVKTKRPSATVVTNGPVTRVELHPSDLSGQVSIGPLALKVHSGLVEELANTLLNGLRNLDSERAAEKLPLSSDDPCCN